MIKNTLKKHLLIVGKSEVDRRIFINDLIEGANMTTFRTKGMKTLEDYADFIKKTKMNDGDYKDKKKWSAPLPILWVFSSHRNWLENTANDGLIIFEELDDYSDGYSYGGFISTTVNILVKKLDIRKKGDKKMLFIASQESEDNFIDNLLKIGYSRRYDTTSRTKRQIIEQNIRIIDITDYQ